MEEKVLCNIYMPKVLKEEIKDIAKGEERNLSNMIVCMLKKAVKEYRSNEQEATK